MIVNERKRQITLSVIGIFILIITILGVSYAVFNYVRNGAKTNQIYTGSVSFSFTEGNDGIYLTDQYPTLYVDTVVKGASSDREKISLNINASISSSTIYYKVFIFNPDTTTTTGSAATGLTTNAGAARTDIKVEKRLPDSCIAVYAESTNSPTHISFNVANAADNNSFARKVSTNKKGGNIATSPATNLLSVTASSSNPTAKELIAYGEVTAGGSAETRTIDIYAYIDSAKCSIIENEETHPSTYDASNVRYYTQADFGGRYYSFKVRVEADTDRLHWKTDSTIKNASTNTAGLPTS